MFVKESFWKWSYKHQITRLVLRLKCNVAKNTLFFLHNLNLYLWYLILYQRQFSYFISTSEKKANWLKVSTYDRMTRVKLIEGWRLIWNDKDESNIIVLLVEWLESTSAHSRHVTKVLMLIIKDASKFKSGQYWMIPSLVTNNNPELIWLLFKAGTIWIKGHLLVSGTRNSFQNGATVPSGFYKRWRGKTEGCIGD